MQTLLNDYEERGFRILTDSHSSLGPNFLSNDNISITIPGELPDFNSELKATNRHWSYYASHKKQWTNLVKYHFMGQKLPIPSTLHFHWYRKNKKVDPDNIAFAKKYILDGIVAAEALPNDGWSEVLGFSDSFSVDKENPRVEIKITE